MEGFFRQVVRRDFSRLLSVPILARFYFIFYLQQISAVGRSYSRRGDDVDPQNIRRLYAEFRACVDEAVNQDRGPKALALIKNDGEHKAPGHGKDDLCHGLGPGLARKQVDDVAHAEGDGHDDNGFPKAVSRHQGFKEEAAEDDFLDEADEEHGQARPYLCDAAMGGGDAVPQIARGQEAHREKVEVSFAVLRPHAQPVFFL